MQSPFVSLMIFPISVPGPTNPSKSDPDLDILETISDAGFMDEYLWVYLKNDQWKNSGTLELEKFNLK